MAVGWVVGVVGVVIPDPVPPFACGDGVGRLPPPEVWCTGRLTVPATGLLPIRVVPPVAGPCEIGFLTGATECRRGRSPVAKVGTTTLATGSEPAAECKPGPEPSPTEAG